MKGERWEEEGRRYVCGAVCFNAVECFHYGVEKGGNGMKEGGKEGRGECSYMPLTRSYEINKRLA